MPDEAAIRIGRELKAYFIRKGYPQEQIANYLGVTQQYVSAMLNGRPFGRNTARKWNKVFGFNPNWLITGEGEMFVGPPASHTTRKAEESQPTYSYEGKNIMERLLALLSEKDKQIQQLLNVVEEQTATIKLLQKNPY